MSNAKWNMINYNVIGNHFISILLSKDNGFYELLSVLLYCLFWQWSECNV